MMSHDLSFSNDSHKTVAFFVHCTAQASFFVCFLQALAL